MKDSPPDTSEPARYSQGSYAASISEFNRGDTRKMVVSKDERALTYQDVLSLWESDPTFLTFYIELLRRFGFPSYVWETPPVSADTLEQVFEFVIVSTPRSSSHPDLETFHEYFTVGGPDCDVVAFPNLGRDAMLIVPSPLGDQANYSGLAEFVTEAPIQQQHALWRVLSREINRILSDKFRWVSVAGGGVSWLHLRIDSAPKYYRHRPYAVPSKY